MGWIWRVLNRLAVGADMRMRSTRSSVRSVDVNELNVDRPAVAFRNDEADDARNLIALTRRYKRMNCIAMRLDLDTIDEVIATFAARVLDDEFVLAIGGNIKDTNRIELIANMPSTPRRIESALGESGVIRFEDLALLAGQTDNDLRIDRRSKRPAPHAHIELLTLLGAEEKEAGLADFGRSYGVGRRRESVFAGQHWIR